MKALVIPVYDDWDYDDIAEIPWRSKAWRRHAKCAGQDTEKYYPPRSRELYKPIADSSKGICKGRLDGHECPVRMQCLTYAISTDEPHGIWGGLSHRERNALVKKWHAAGSPLPLTKFVTTYMHTFKA